MNLKYHNIKRSYLITAMISLVGVLGFALPLLFSYMLPNSGITSYIIENKNYILLLIPVFVYIIIKGIFFYKISIDNYVIQIVSSRTISGIFGKRNYVDISHKMLEDYSFFERPFSINKTLMLKIRNNNRRIIKRFNMTLISEEEIEGISSILDKIIVKNN
ncbi:MAG: hypothetical protein CMD16_01510 [Flavobacteriales bacterium]|nr:hypothetical protein [Flavobacteriales bacterium]